MRTPTLASSGGQMPNVGFGMARAGSVANFGDETPPFGEVR